MSEIRKSYKSMSKIYHPDKNMGDNKDSTAAAAAAGVYQSIQEAYAVLVDVDSRDIYNRFGITASTAAGTAGTASTTTNNASKYDPRKDELKLVSDIAIAYVFWVIVCLVITTPVQTRGARSFNIMGGMVMLVVECMLTFSEPNAQSVVISAYLLPFMASAKLTEYEFIFALHSLFPVFVVGACSVAALMYTDIQRVTFAVLHDVLVMQKRMHHIVQDVQDQLHDEEGEEEEGGGEGGGTGICLQVQGREAVQKTLSGHLKEIELSRAIITQEVYQLDRASNQPSHSYYWIFFVVLFMSSYVL